MTNPEIETLERDVEQARGRLVADLARLRSAGEFSDLKRDVTEEVSRTKNQMVGAVKDAARQRAESVFDGIKARVAANPGAALAIGAGLAWRLYRHPPIASLLVGAGLVGLFRTDPEHPAMGADFAARATNRAVDFAGTARDKVDEWRASETAGQIGEFAATARERAGEAALQVGEFAATATERAREFTAAATDQAGEFAATATRKVGDLADTAREKAGEVAEAARRRVDAWRSDPADEPAWHGSNTPGAWKANGRRVAARSHGDLGGRDTYLLGAAGLALAAAIGIAYKRRLNEQQPPRFDR